MVTLTNLERPAASYGPMSLLQKLLKSMADLETPSKTGFQTIPMLSSYHFGNSLIGDQIIKYQAFFSFGFEQQLCGPSGFTSEGRLAFLALQVLVFFASNFLLFFIQSAFLGIKIWFLYLPSLTGSQHWASALGSQVLRFCIIVFIYQYQILTDTI